MSKHLVIVESPAKAKTIQKYLGKDYEVLASYGHVRDLAPRKGSVDPDKNFTMSYTPVEKNIRHIDSIAKTLKNSQSLLLATDPDREGEAISWHIFELMRERNLLKDKEVHRIFFNEITKTAIQEAINNPRNISMDLVNAQQARRALDYLVGFNLSPLLWKKIRRGLSAGRVQSPALRLIVEREEEIEKFVPQEYWKILAKCQYNDANFLAKLTHYEKQKLQQFTIQGTEQAQEIRDKLIQLAQGELLVTNVEKKQRKRKPASPFITSTLQQEAARKLGFTARKTMMVAQQLYEGIDIGTGTVGLISYMRTDSVNLSQEAIIEIREYIEKRYGSNNCPPSPRIYKTKSKNAQEAHEAIRPTSILRTPETVEQALTPDQYKLYNLIWRRSVACQMEDALIDTVAVDLACGSEENIFRANGSTIAFPGFLSVYEESLDDISDDEQQAVILPNLKIGEKVILQDIAANQHFTEPPPRYSEASLVKALEEYDIGRPSTYATIIHTLQQREYVVVEKKRFVPTDVGRIVNRFLTGHFTRYVDYQFTAHLEDTLDAISRGEKEWIPVLKEFWQPFNQQIHVIDENIQRKDVTTETLEETCPKCNKPLSIRLGKRGRFIGCTGFPECDYTQALNNEGEKNEPVVVEGRVCPECSNPLHIKSGRYGRFIGCSNYPECKHMEPLEKPADTGVECPQCHSAKILQRKSRKGKIFFSCGNYPKCNYALWNEPINKPCPQCHWPLLTVKETKRSGRQIICPKEGCSYSTSETAL
ncbi:DNA topoisomerase I [Legionella busanensis]|uniref:DNA topoisomerase 1 n=1 Tax=Legionella busanensis TaxID=190655 RepID=A0A378JNL0_9GAMM|nr:type I DNA topoisomerase [Legionella busanensis]STX52667.1 DNA topoisomerase I [Legionella busanensis]